MRRIPGAIAAGMLLTMASPAAAQVALEANAARAEGRWGAELGAGYTVLAIDGFRVTPSVGAFIHENGDDRFTTVDDVGEERCRDQVTGQFADDDRCDDAGVKLYGRVEATFTLPLAGVSIGTGARLSSSDFRPYGTLSVPLLPLINLKGNVGPKYYAAGLSARF